MSQNILRVFSEKATKKEGGSSIQAYKRASQFFLFYLTPNTQCFNRFSALIFYLSKHVFFFTTTVKEAHYFKEEQAMKWRGEGRNFQVKGSGTSILLFLFTFLCSCISILSFQNIYHICSRSVEVEHIFAIQITRWSHKLNLY